MRDRDTVSLENLYQQTIIRQMVEEQNDLASDMEKIAKNVFNSAYQDWSERQNKKAAGIAYKTYGDLWIRPTIDGKLLSISELEKFTATVEGGKITRTEVYKGQKDPDILPAFIVSVDMMSDQVPLVMIESPIYKIQEPLPVKIQDTKEDITVPVIKKF